MQVRASEFDADPGSYAEDLLARRIERWRAHVDWLRSDNPYLVGLAAYVYGREGRHPHSRRADVEHAVSQLHEQLQLAPFPGQFGPWVDQACDRATTLEVRVLLSKALTAAVATFGGDFRKEKLVDRIAAAASEDDNPLAEQLRELHAAIDGN